MVSKNNAYLKEVMHSHRVPHYGLRKLGIGVTSVLLGTTLYFGANAPVHADVTPATNGNGTNTGANVTPNSAVNNVESGRSVTLGQTNNSMSAPTSTTATSSTANQATANQNSGSVVSAQVTVQNSARVATPSQANVKASSAVGQSSNYQTVDVSQLGKMIQNPVSGGTVASSATNSSVTNSNISLTDSKIQKYTETVASQQSTVPATNVQLSLIDDENQFDTETSHSAGIKGSFQVDSSKLEPGTLIKIGKLDWQTPNNLTMNISNWGGTHTVFYNGDTNSPIGTVYLDSSYNIILQVQHGLPSLVGQLSLSFNFPSFLLLNYQTDQHVYKNYDPFNETITLTDNDGKLLNSNLYTITHPIISDLTTIYPDTLMANNGINYGQPEDILNDYLISNNDVLGDLQKSYGAQGNVNESPKSYYYRLIPADGTELRNLAGYLGTFLLPVHEDGKLSTEGERETSDRSLTNTQEKDGLSLKDLDAMKFDGVRFSKQKDNSYLFVFHISNNDLTPLKQDWEVLADSASVVFSSNEQATMDRTHTYYNGKLSNRYTAIFPELRFNYENPSVRNSYTFQKLDKQGNVVREETENNGKDYSITSDQSKLTAYYVDENTGKILDGNNGNVVTENPELVQPASEDISTGDTHLYIESADGNYVKVNKDINGDLAVNGVTPQYVEVAIANEAEQKHPNDIKNGKLAFTVGSNNQIIYYKRIKNSWNVPVKQFNGYQVETSPKVENGAVKIGNIGHIVLRDNDAVPVVTAKSTTTEVNFPDEEGQSSRVYIFYKGDKQTAQVTYEDVTNPKNPVILRKADGNPAVDTVKGPTGVTSSYSSAKQIQYFESQHYLLQNDGTKNGIVFSTDPAKNQYVVTFTHGINKGVTQTKQVTRTINYVYAGNHKQAAVPTTQTLTFTRTVDHDNVTGQDIVVKGQDWKSNQTSFTAVTAPIVKGYTSIYEDRTGDEMDPVTVPAANNVTATTPNSTVTVYYAPAKAENETATINYVDEQENDAIIKSDSVQGQADSTIDYSTAKEIAALQNMGYKLVSDGFTKGAVYDDNPQAPQVFTVVLTHGTTTVTPDNPGTPGKPINPNYPKNNGNYPGPEYPAGTDAKSLTVPGTQVVHYEGAGAQTPKDNVTNITFKKQIVIDKVDGHVISQGWDQTSQTYPRITTPTIAGYTPDPNDVYVGGETVTGDNPNRAYTIRYTKVTTPTVNDQHAQVRYLDEDNNNAEIPNTNSGDLTGKPGTQIKYSTANTIAKLTNQGYVLVNNDFDYGNQVQYFDDNDATDQVFIVTLKHGTEDITPINPGTPGQPVNPNDPNGPKYPVGTDAKSLIKQGTQTIHYVGPDGKTIQPDNVSHVEFAHHLIIDKVNGNLTDDGWTPDIQTYQVIGTPAVSGYTPDHQYIGGETVGRENPDRTYTVHYTKNTVPVVNDQHAEVRYLDQDANNAQIANSGDLTGKPGSRIKYSTADELNQLLSKGYVLVSNGFDQGAQVQYFDDNDSSDQIFIVTLKHGQTKVNKDHPNNRVKADLYTKVVKETVHYQGAGNQTPADHVQNAEWDRTITVDNVTNQIVNETAWTPSQTSYDSVDTPKVAGYTADKDYIPSTPVTMSDVTSNVTYMKNVQPSGNQTSQGSNSQTSQGSQSQGSNSQTSQGSQSQGSNSQTSQGSQSQGSNSQTSQGSQSQGSNSQTSQGSQSQGSNSQTSQGSQSQGSNSQTSQGSQSQGSNSQTSQGSQSQGSNSQTSQGSQSQGSNSQTSQGSQSQGSNSQTSQGSQSQGSNSQTSQGSQSQSSNSQTSQGSQSQGSNSQTSQGSQSQGSNSQTSQGSQSQGSNSQTSQGSNSQTSQGSQSQGSNSQTSQGSQSQGSNSQMSQGSQSQGSNSQTSQGSQSQGSNSQTSQGSQSQGSNSQTSQGSQSQGSNSQTSQGSQSQGSNSQTSQGSQSQGSNSQTSQGSQSQGSNSQTSQGSQSQGSNSQTSQGSQSQGSNSQTSQGSQSQGSNSQTSQGSQSQGSNSQMSQGSQSQGSNSQTSQGSQSQSSNSQTSQGSQSQGSNSQTSQGSQSQGSNSQTSQGSQSQGSNSQTSQPSEPTQPTSPTQPTGQNQPTSQPSGQQPSGQQPSGQTPTTDNERVIVHYVDPNGNPITTDTITGQGGQPINYDPSKTLTDLTNKGYDVTGVTNPTTGQNFDHNPSSDQSYTVTVKHGTAPLGPNNQHEAGTPINPNDPNGAKWPSADNYSQNYTYTVHFVGPNGQPLTGDNVQTSTWTRTVTVDKVTGQIIGGSNWTPSQNRYSDVQVPVINGYYTNQATIPGQPTVQQNISKTVNYQPVGQIIPVDPNGNPIGNGQNYQNNPSNPTEVTGNQTVPTIPGYTPSTSTVTPTNPGANTQVTYTKNGKGNSGTTTPTNESTTTITYVDQNSGQPVKTVTLNGQPGSSLGYNPATDEQTLENQGYEIVKNNIPDNATFGSTSEHYTITVKHGTTTLGPNNQHEAGTPINPNDPNGAKWPAKDTYSKSYTSTVHFVGPDGQQLTNDNVQTSTWTRTVTIDKVTGKVVSGTDWTTTTKNYQDVQVPVINGYVASQKTVTGQPAVQKNLTTTVTYQKLGQIVPVDQNGNPIGNAQTYQNDPNDPTKVVPNEAVPTISGYTPSTNTVTPTNPSVNTTITYNKSGSGTTNSGTNGNSSTTNNSGTTNSNGASGNTNSGSTTNGNGSTANNGSSTGNTGLNGNANGGLTNGTGSVATNGTANNSGVNFGGNNGSEATGNSSAAPATTNMNGNNAGSKVTTTTTTTTSNSDNSGNNITLPQTGNATNKAAILGAAGVELAATLGLAGLAARKKHDVE